MDTKSLLDELLQSAKQMASQGQEVAETKLGVPEEGPDRDAMLKGMGKGAMAAGALALLLGTGAGRRLTGTALKLGSLAAIASSSSADCTMLLIRCRCHSCRFTQCFHCLVAFDNHYRKLTFQLLPNDVFSRDNEENTSR